MSDKKYTATEVARMVLERAQETLKKNEELLKTNTAHEIEDGVKPDTKGAECPPSLAAGEHSESAEMEDTPLQGEDSEDSEEKKDKDKDKKEESEEKEYEFAKSETGMHTVVYKKLSKANTFGTGGASGSSTPGIKGFGSVISGGTTPPVNKDEDGKSNPSFDREKKDVEWTGSQKKMVDATKPGKGRKSNRDDQKKFVEAAKQRRQKMKEEGLIKEEIEKGEGVSVEEAVSMIMSDKYEVHDVMDMVSKDKRDDVMAALRQKDTKKSEMCKGYMEKCGEMNKEEMDKCGEMKAGKKLKKFMKKSKKGRCWDGYEPVPGKKAYSEDSCKKK